MAEKTNIAFSHRRTFGCKPRLDVFNQSLFTILATAQSESVYMFSRHQLSKNWNQSCVNKWHLLNVCIFSLSYSAPPACTLTSARIHAPLPCLVVQHTFYSSHLYSTSTHLSSHSCTHSPRIARLIPTLHITYLYIDLNLFLVK